MSSSLSYWITIFNDDGTVLDILPVNAWIENGGIKVDTGSTEHRVLDVLQRNMGKRLTWERAWEEITLTPEKLLSDQLEQQQQPIS